MDPAAKPPWKVLGLDHVVLCCRDRQRTLDFYTRVMGLRAERSDPDLGLVQLRAGTSMIDLVPAGAPAGTGPVNLDHFCIAIAVTDLGAAIRYLATHGVEIAGEPKPRYGATGMGPSVYLRDPEGNVIELKQTAPAAAGAPA